MKKKVILLTIAAVMTILMGCETVQETSGSEGTDYGYFEFTFLHSAFPGLTEYRDEKTGVHYIIYERDGIGICPRYNADGTLYVD